MDRTFGNALFGLDASHGFIFAHYQDKTNPLQNIPLWWIKLIYGLSKRLALIYCAHYACLDPPVTQQIKDRWAKLRQGPFNTKKVMDTFDALHKKLSQKDALEREVVCALSLFSLLMICLL